MSLVRVVNKTHVIQWRLIVFSVLASFTFFSSSVFCDDLGFPPLVEIPAKKTGKVEQAVEKAVEKAVDQAAVKATIDASITAEQTSKRPDEWRGATKVHFLVFMIDINAIDDTNQNFTANIYLRLSWKDPRFAKEGVPSRQIPLESVWNPRVVLANRTGLVSKSLPDVVTVEADGTVTYHQRYTGKLSQPLRLSEFPMDKHTFTAQFTAMAYSAEDLEFIPDQSIFDPLIIGGDVSDELSLTDWNIQDYETLSMPYSPVKEVNSAGFGARFVAERYFSYYLWQIILPMTVVVVMSWAAFWVGRDNVGVRIGVATSSVLTLNANRFVFASLLPRLPYMTRMDYFTVGSTLLVFLALIMVVLINFLEAKEKHRLGARLNILARGTFPVLFVGLFVWFTSP